MHREERTEIYFSNFIKINLKLIHFQFKNTDQIKSINIFINTLKRRPLSK
jgi:hypothetical protein